MTQRKGPTGRDRCLRITFSLANALGGGATFYDLATHLGLDPDQEQAVIEACKARAVGVPLHRHLPPLAGVVLDDSGAELPGLTNDVDVTIAVLARASDRAFIRRHYPVVDRDRLERTVTLIVTDPGDQRSGS